MFQRLYPRAASAPRRALHSAPCTPVTPFLQTACAPELHCRRRLFREVPDAPGPACLGCIRRGQRRAQSHASQTAHRQDRRTPIRPHDNPDIGCIILVEPFFFPEGDWIPSPPDFALNTVTGKGYDAEDGTVRLVWQQVLERLDRQRATRLDPGPATIAAIESARYGRPTSVMPRLGQGAFQVLVADAYGRRCAMTNVKTLPVLEAAHIRPYHAEGPHQLSNGLLLRSYSHRLFDLGNVTVDPGERRIVVSRRIREKFENGRDYYQLQGRPVTQPNDPCSLPAREYLDYHAGVIFR